MKSIDDLNVFLRKSPSCVMPFELFEYVDAIDKDVTRLECEVKLLRGLNKYDNESVHVLMDENLKLRGLAARAISCVHQMDEIEWSCVGCDFISECNGWFQIEDSAHELGIGVPE